MPKTGSETTAEKQTVKKKGRHVNNKIPEFENFFQGDTSGNSKGDGKGFIWRLIKKDRRYRNCGVSPFPFLNEKTA